MDIVSITSFLGVAALLTVMPGPDNLFVLAQSISNGRYAGISTSLGLCTGLLGHIAAATLGLSAVIYQSALAFAIVKYAGAAYLLYLAYKTFTAKDSALAVENKEAVEYKAFVVVNQIPKQITAAKRERTINRFEKEAPVRTIAITIILETETK